LKLAEALKIDAVTPSQVTPGFVGEIVNNLDTLWAKRFDCTPERMTFVFDPRIEYRDGGSADRMEAFPANHGIPVYRADGSVLCTPAEVLDDAMRNMDSRRRPYRPS